MRATPHRLSRHTYVYMYVTVIVKEGQIMNLKGSWECIGGGRDRIEIM